MGDEKFLKILSVNGVAYTIKDEKAWQDIAALSGIALDGATSLSGAIAALKEHGADSALSGVNYVQTQLNTLSGAALNGETSLSGTIDALKTKEEQDVTNLTGAIGALETTHNTDKAALSGSIAALSGVVNSNNTALEGKISTVSGVAKKNADDIKALSGVVDDLSGVVDALSTTVDTNNTNLATAITGVYNTLSGSIATVSGTARKNQLDIDALSGVVDTNNTNLATAISGVQTNLNNAITGMYYSDTAVAGQFITEVDQVDGKITVQRAGVSADQVMVSTITGINATGPSVQSALESLASHVTDTEAAGKVTITPTTGGNNDAFAKKYTIYQGDTSNPANLVGEIDIPKDMVVSGGQVFTATGAGEGYVVGDKVLEITIANNDGTKLYIPVKDLTDTYTGVSGSEIITNVNASNGIEASLVTGSITKDKLATAVQTSLGKADTSIQHVNGKPSDNAGGDVNIYGTEINRSESDNTTIQSALTTIEGSVSAIDTRVSGLEAWHSKVTAVYNSTTETLAMTIL